MNSIVLVHSQSAQSRAHVTGELLILCEAHVVVLAQLVVLPLLVLCNLFAIYLLFDLLGLLVDVEQLSVTKSFGVAILGGAPLDDVVKGRYIFGWPRYELVLSTRMSTWDRLAVDLGITGGFDAVGWLLVGSRLGHKLLKVGLRHVVGHDCKWKRVYDARSAGVQ